MNKRREKSEMRSRLISIFVLVAVLLTPLAFVSPAVAASPGDVVINEIMQNPSAVGDGDGEWFEVYNATGSDIDINGWTIKDNDIDSHVINNGGPLLVPAGGFLVLGNNADSSTNGGVPIDYNYGGSWFLSNSADEVVLLDNALTEIDRVEYDGGPNFPDPNGASMALVDPTLDNNVGANWCEATTPYGLGDMGTPGAENDCNIPTPSIVINEIMQNPNAVFDSAGEWFELYNAGSQDVDINGWTIADNDFDSHVINNGGPLVISAGGFLVLGNNADSGTNGGVSVDYNYGGSWFLANGADEVVLLDNALTEIDRVEYDGGPTFPDPNGASMALRDPSLDNNVGANWCTSSTPFGDGDFGTPGAANDCPSAPPPPPDLVSIFDIQFTEDPSGDSPLEGETVTTQGVVTAFFFTGGNRLFFIQDGTGPWNGLFLFNPNGFLNVGDLVQVTGTVSEFIGLTEIAFGDATVIGSASVPDPEVLPTDAVSQEQWESVLVRVEDVTVTDENLGFGEWLVDDGGGGVRVDDLGFYNYEPQNGDLLSYVQGPLYYSFGDFKIEPRDDQDLAQVVTIMEIQGAGHISPYVGQNVTTNGVVTAVAFDSYYVQDPVGDGDDATSDGIFVFKTGSKPDVGDLVRLTDTVAEFIPGGAGTGNLSTTEMAFPNIEVLSTGNPLPDPVIIGLSGRVPPNVDVISDDELPVNLQTDPGLFDPADDGIDFYESLEGMLVTVEDAVAVSAVRSFGNFSSELFTLPNNGHPQIIEPNNARTDRGGIKLTADPDGYGDLNPERVQIQFDASDIRTGTLYPSTVPAIAVGDRLGDVIGVMNYDFGNFEVRAIEVLSITPAGLAPETTSLAGTENAVTVASYNVLNLSPLSSDDDQRAALASQIVNNLGSPDVIALQEIQDNNGDISDCEDQNSEEFCEALAETGDGVVDANETLQALVDSIEAAGGPAYAYFNVNPFEGTSGGIPLGNIRNAFLYNPERVELDSFVSLTPVVLGGVGADPDAFFDTRNPLAATFVFNGEAFTVINNHLSSRSGSTPIFGGLQPFLQADEDGREAQIQALNDYVDFLLESDKDARVIVLGDFNTFEFTNDLTEILPGTLDGKAIMKTLLTEVVDDNRYTFIFDGNSQVLDHMLATRSLLEQAELDIVHVNVDFPRRRTDTVGSDHEPLVARFGFGGNH